MILFFMAVSSVLMIYGNLRKRGISQEPTDNRATYQLLILFYQSGNLMSIRGLHVIMQRQKMKAQAAEDRQL